MAPNAVWAPYASTVQLETAPGAHRPLRAGEGGWWHGEPHTGPYRLVIDGDPLPDPRSPWQPEGVSGPSHTVDHEAFAWTDDHWRGFPLGAAVFYELHVGTFTAGGTFDAVIDRLDHLSDLGVTAIELMPVNEFPGGRGWGYDGVLLFAPHHAYGGPDGLKRLVDACHARGLGVVLDVVYNHLGPSGNHLGRFGPYFTSKYHTPWGDAVNLDEAGSDETRRFFCDNALSWFRDYHVDALRIDAVHAFHDESAIPFLEQLAVETHDLSRHLDRSLWLIAESDLNDPRLVRARDAGGYGLDAQWSDDLHHALHAVLSGDRQGYYSGYGTLADIAAAYERVFVYDGRHSPYRGRRHGRPVGALPRDRFVVFLQNHDQVGNRAQGDRIGHLASAGRQAIGAALTLTSPFVPLVFQGEEWAASAPFPYFTDHPDPDLGDAVRQGRRREFAAFGWRPEDVPDPQDRATFASAVLDWSEAAAGPHRRMLDWYRQLLELRRTQPDLVRAEAGDTAVRCDESAGWLLVERRSVCVAVNVGEARQLVPTAPAYRTVAATWSGTAAVTGGGVELDPDDVTVLTSGSG